MRKLIKSILVLIFILILVKVVFWGIDIFQKEKLKNDFESKLDIREELIEKVKTNELKLDENNHVILTEKYYDVAENDYVIVYVCNDKEKVISFLYKAGIPDEDKYIFYSSSNDDLIKKYVPKSYYSYIEKITDNWYIVQFN